MTDQTCEQRVNDRWQSRREDLRLMLQPTWRDVELVDAGTLDTTIRIGEVEQTFDAESAAEWRDEDTGAFDPDPIQLQDILDGFEEDLYERFNEYALAFDFVAPDTFDDQSRGYFRYQISWGGPSDEIRFYCDHGQPTPDCIEYWFLDWFDGAHIDVTADAVALAVWYHLSDSVDAIRAAA